MGTVLFLINNHSGNNDGTHLTEILQKTCTDTVVVREIDWTDTSSILSDYKRYSYLVAAGGDGTCSAIIRALPEDSPPLAIYPLGTGNDLARELGFSRFWSHNCLRSGIDKLESLTRREIDIWTISDANDRSNIGSFVNYCSIGFSAKVIQAFASERESKQRSAFGGRLVNRVNYLRHSLQNLSKLISRGITVYLGDSKEGFSAGQARCLLFTNIRSLLGFGHSPFNSDPFDNKIEAGLVRSVFDYAFFALFSRGLSTTKLGAGDIWKVTGLEDEVNINCDGESLALHSRAIEISKLRTATVLVNNL